MDGAVDFWLQFLHFIIMNEKFLHFVLVIKFLGYY